MSGVGNKSAAKSREKKKKNIRVAVRGKEPNKESIKLPGWKIPKVIRDIIKKEQLIMKKRGVDPAKSIIIWLSNTRSKFIGINYRYRCARDRDRIMGSFFSALLKGTNLE